MEKVVTFVEVINYKKSTLSKEKRVVYVGCDGELSTSIITKVHRVSKSAMNDCCLFEMRRLYIFFCFPY